MDEKILELLKLLSIQKKNNNERFKHLAILKAISILKKYPNEIKSLKDVEELKDLPNIGDGMIKRITEIVKTGKLKELDDTPNLYVIKELTSISGIGEKNALKLIDDHNIKSILDLKNKIKSGQVELTNAQNIGLKYHYDLSQRIPRKEIQHAEKIIRSVVKEVNPEIDMEIVGSYRRKKLTSGDIDVLFTHKKNQLNQIIKALEEKGILFEQISKGGKKYSGIIKVDKLGRRIDILFVKPENYPAALLYFTGSGDHNQKMRSIAKSKNFKLNEYNLQDEKGNQIKVKNEKDIFEKLDMEYLDPENREVE
jgi:DNA polymerase/3'-5' exonuclease PolX